MLFFFLYHALFFRFYQYHDAEFQWLGIENNQHNTLIANILFYVAVWVSGIVFHARQSGLSDYYRQIHLFFLKGKVGSELDSSAQQKRLYEETPWKGNLIYKLFLLTYINYTRTQEKQTPQFQRLKQALKTTYGNTENIPQTFRDEFRRLSLPLMKWANILTFNTRAITLYFSFLLDLPWLYPMAEMTLFAGLYFYMRHTHEGICKKITHTTTQPHH